MINSIKKTIGPRQPLSSSPMKVSEIAFYHSLRAFYAEELLAIMKQFKRGRKLSIFLLIAKFAEQIVILLNENILQSLVDIEGYLSFIGTYNPQTWLSDNESTCTIAVYIMIGFNALLIFYLIVKVIIFIFHQKAKKYQLRLQNFIDDKEIAEKKNRQHINEQIASFIFQIYNYILMAPFLLISSIQLNSVSGVNIALTLLISIFISNNDYDYMLGSQDILKQKYIEISVLSCLLEGIIYIIMRLIDRNESVLLMMLLAGMDGVRLIAFEPYFDPVYLFISGQTISGHTFSIFAIIFIPFLFKIGLEIEDFVYNQQILQFDKQFKQGNRISPDILNSVLRAWIADQSTNNINNNSASNEISNNNRILWRNQNISKIIEADKAKASAQNANAGIYAARSQSQYSEELEFLEMRGFMTDEKEIDGKIYTSKEQAYGENKESTNMMKEFFKEVFARQRNPKHFGIGDLYYLVFIVEVLQNYQLFELTITQMQKNINLKHLQALSSIKREVEVQKELIRMVSDEEQLYDLSYQEALMYDEQIVTTQRKLEELISKKINLLVVMKQRTINLEDLQKLLDGMLESRSELIRSIQLMIKVNEYNLKLYDIYLNYLEALSFSESDIKLEQYNRYQKSESHLYFQMNSNDACVLFASFKSPKEAKIVKISNNFEAFFGFRNEHILGQTIETLMPEAIGKCHHHFVASFFERGEQSTLKKDSLFFPLNHTGHIIPSAMDIKVNYLASEKDFGITAYFQRAYKSNQYILFNAATSRMISMTQELHSFTFSSLKSLVRVNLLHYFPFLMNFRTGNNTNSQYNQLSGKSVATVNSEKTFPARQQSTVQLDSQKQSHPLQESSKIVKDFSLVTKKEYVNQPTVAQVNKEKKQSPKVKGALYETKISRMPQNTVDREILLQKRLKQSTMKQSAAVAAAVEIDQPFKSPDIFRASTNGGFQTFEEEYDDSDDRKYQDLQYLLVIQKTYISTMTMMSKTKTGAGLDDYQFFNMTINIATMPQKGLESIKYLQITNIKQISPLHNVKMIKQAYNNEISNFLSNLSSLRSSDLSLLMQELELRSKDSNRSLAELKDNSKIDIENVDGEQLNQNHEDDTLLYSGKQADNILYNRRESNSLNVGSHQFQDLHGMSASKKIDYHLKPNGSAINYEEQQQVSKSQLKDIIQQRTKTNSINSSTANMIPNRSINYQEVQNESQDITNQKFISGGDVSLEVHNISHQNLVEDKKYTLDQSYNQYAKLPSFEASFTAKKLAQNSTTAGIGNQITNSQSVLYNQVNVDQNSQSKSNLSAVTQMNSQAHLQFPYSQNNNNNNNPEQIIQGPISPMYFPMTPDMDKYGGNISAYPLFAQFGGNNDNISADQGINVSNKNLLPEQQQQQQQQIFTPKTNDQFFSPKILSSTNRAYNVIKSSTFLSPMNRFSVNYGLINKQTTNEEILVPQKLQPVSPSQQDQMTLKKHHQQSQSSMQELSKKRKLIEAMKQKQNVKNLKEALDLSSNHSRESSSSSTRKSTKSIILQKSTLGIMKLVNIIGIISFSCIIGVMLEQYFVMNSDLNTYNEDLKYINWSTSYSNYLSIIKEYYNVYQLLVSGYIVTTNISKDKLYAQQEMQIAGTDMHALLLNILEASSDRQIVQQMVNTDFMFEYGSMIDNSVSLAGQSSKNSFNLIGFTDSLYISTLNIYTYLYRYIQIDDTIARFIAISNTDTLVAALTVATNVSREFSLSQLSSIKTSVNDVLIIICLVMAGCIFVIIPVYSFIQIKREEFIQLFATFNSSFLDVSIQEIMKISQKISNSKFSNLLNANNTNQKRQNLSSTTRIHRINQIVIIVSLLIYAITLPYPILNQVLPTKFVTQNQETLPMLETLYTLQSDILRESGMIFFCLSLKFNIETITNYTFDQFVTQLDDYMAESVTIQTNLQQAIQNIQDISVFDQSTLDSYFFKAFEENVCILQMQYSQYLVSGSTFNTQDCTKVQNGILTKGITVSVKSLFSTYNTLYEIIKTSDQTQFQNMFAAFQNDQNFYDFLEFQQSVVEVIDALTNYLEVESQDYKNYLQNVLLALLLYQFSVLFIIFYFGWVQFYFRMNAYMHKTKFYLALLNITYLVQNPYVQNYLHNNVS